MIVAALLGLSFPRGSRVERFDTIFEEPWNEFALLDTL